jgi:hypothetical protein
LSGQALAAVFNQSRLKPVVPLRESDAEVMFSFMAPVPLAQEKKTWTPDPGRRRSMRVLLSVPILVSGKTLDNKNFEEEARTLVVNAHGALISLAAGVASGQKLTIHNKATQQSIECKIVYLGNPQAGKTQMGIEFVKALASFWQIDFPPDDWVVPES